ncbi:MULTISPECIES: hypothetical protein [Xanthomonas]|uniref:Secreted protein n=1 Tax=Xanthomonas campestris pv. phaseoli TaxID=317013 RepID=A0A7Z7NHA3_XANCH|nr:MULTISPECIES: hypothetical protein [Xanthomonas]QTD87938.1 hypothetical protein XcfCFBP6988P_23625 [Xanthomonas citri pv. phaseoli var. fuscans]QTF14025.1 hypothetical protein XcfCFBP6989P_23535 [Xanthomonas citri pv. phaseoli var. fuscans]QTF14246.1 hypothetical protein XcfCFBP6991P_24280 [Xanthomonas citri pv. phaseoli var. fuscans]QTF76221.1 hypothetical protein XcfCFBP6990P_23570 [Xanthomonas citri pv. phaseoli var. fuscans]UZA98029.1 hypothetical protein OM946_12515 [Xanthomonas citri 
MKFIHIGIALIATAIAGCSTSGTAVRIGENTYPPVTPDHVVLLVAAPSKPHEVIALVEGVAATDDYFTKERTEAAAIKAMKEKAASLGADAIVLTSKGSAPYGQISTGTAYGSSTQTAGNITGLATVTSTSMGWEKITFSGTAVRYKGH